MKPKRNRIIKSFSFQPEEEKLLALSLAKARQVLPPIDNGGPNISETVRLALHVLAIAPTPLLHQAAHRLTRVVSGCPGHPEPMNLSDMELEDDQETQQRFQAMQELNSLLAGTRGDPIVETRIQELRQFFGMIPFD
jgi:hypothetical protein